MTDPDGQAPLSSPKLDSESLSHVRLHITPLDPELLKVVVSSAVLPRARNISFHTIETFPEKRYGFLELPNEDADKLRKKLNGAVLKGVRIRIERARPPQIPAPLAEAAMARETVPDKAADGSRVARDRSKKRKRGTEELGGVVLEAGRKIKRGWTSSEEQAKEKKRPKRDKEKKGNQSKKQSKSKYTDHAECLVKTVLPANRSTLADGSTSIPTKRKKRAGSREVIVHEFERTAKFPSFLKASTPTARPGAPLEFVDGMGWVDQDGNVVEPVKARPLPSAKVLLSQTLGSRNQKTAATDEVSTPDLGDDEFAAESPSVRDDHLVSKPAETPGAHPTPSVSRKSDVSRPQSSGSVRSLSIKIPPATPNEPKVHPLEALYKRPRQPDGEPPQTDEAARGFSFFADGSREAVADGAGADSTDASGFQIPLTPFTRQDLELRGIRSAAPTPDTAHPSRRFAPWGAGDAEGEYVGSEEEGGKEEQVVDEPQSPSRIDAAPDQEGQEGPTSDFQKWFWENRGNLNRSWKKRRKLAGKEKRYRENKARMARAI